jgi:hypothetical protein
MGDPLLTMKVIIDNKEKYREIAFISYEDDDISNDPILTPVLKPEEIMTRNINNQVTIYKRVKCI